MSQEMTTTGKTTKSDSPSEKAEQAYCSNCGENLGGQFCHACGQSTKSAIKFFGEVAKELLDDTLGYDSRLKHSLFPLFFKPGRITLDYVKGKRFYYVLPFRLYLIMSVLFILLVKNTADTDIVKFDPSTDSVKQQQITEQVNQKLDSEFNKALHELNQAGKVDKEDVEEINEMKREFMESTSSPINTSLEKSGEQSSIKSEESDQQDKDSNNSHSFRLNWDSKTQKFKGLEQMEEGIPKMFLTRIEPKISDWRKDPKPLIDELFELFPYMMFVILPLFALILKLFYIFSKRYYTEHLVFLLHNHSFIYMLMMTQVLLSLAESKLKGIDSSFSHTIAGGAAALSNLLGFWMIIYVFLAMKRFYHQGWGATISKTVILGFIYMILISAGMLVTLAFGAYQA